MEEDDPFLYMPIAELLKTIHILESTGEQPELLVKVKKILDDRGGTSEAFHPDSKRSRGFYE